MAFLRDDRLWDLEATLVDRKARTFPGGAGDRIAGARLHDLSLCLTIDTPGFVLAASAGMHGVPFDGICQESAADYQLLIGLNLFRGFRAELKKRLGRRMGCTHLSEMALLMPTLAIQSFAGVVYPIRDDGTQGEQPAALDGCRGLRIEGEAVRQFFPRWYVKPNDSSNT